MCINRPISYPKTTRYSIFAYGVPNLEYDKQGTLNYMSLSSYCKLRFISRQVVKTFAKKGWVVITKTRHSRISVAEICPEQINIYLGLCSAGLEVRI